MLSHDHAPDARSSRQPIDAALLRSLARGVEAGDLIPYLGPGLLDPAANPEVPATPEALAHRLAAQVPVGKALRGNLWGTAQFIEQRRHRKTLVQMLQAAFPKPAVPGDLHRWLAGVKVPLIVDTWYDGALAAAFRAAGRRDFMEIQGVTRALEQRDVWTRAYDALGKPTPIPVEPFPGTVIYEPHGSCAPAGNFLAADSDYVEVLTEIDIQTPIPALVQALRQARGFLFVGCRFHDQMLRTYARQIMKRSRGPAWLVCDFVPTRMEHRFFEEAGIKVIEADLGLAVAGMTAA